MTEEGSGGGHVAARGEGRELFIGTLQVSAEQSGGSLEVIVLSAGPAGTAGPVGYTKSVEFDVALAKGH